MHQPRKRFGQHFLTDDVIITRIVKCINPKSDQNIVEIGPGLGAITIPLLQRCHHLQVVELDRDLIPKLERKCSDKGKITVHNIDALDFDFCSLTNSPQTLRLVGNLPYNISTPLLFHLVYQSQCIQDMHFMLQKEVVERMAAQPGSKVYGRLSIMMQYYCQVEPLFTIGKESFSPPPKVESAFVRLVPQLEPPVQIDNMETFQALVKAAFSQRRKTLRNALKNLLTGEQFEFAQVDSRCRAEQISLEQFARLSNVVGDTTTTN